MAKDISAPQGIESRRLEVNGRRTHYLKAGTGKPVVLVHGGASDGRDWLTTMAQCGDRFTFYAPDLPGFGESDRDDKGYYLSDFSDFLLGFIAALKLDRPALAGHSFGARVCLDAVRQPGNNISQLILIDASGLGKMALPGMILFGFFTSARKILGKTQPYPRFLTREGDNWDYVGDAALKSIKAPTLLIWKRTDPYLPLAIARRAERLIPGAKLAVVEGYGHAPHQQNDNSQFIKLLREFLDGDDKKTA